MLEDINIKFNLSLSLSYHWKIFKKQCAKLVYKRRFDIQRMASCCMLSRKPVRSVIQPSPRSKVFIVVPNDRSVVGLKSRPSQRGQRHHNCSNAEQGTVSPPRQSCCWTHWVQIYGSTCVKNKKESWREFKPCILSHQFLCEACLWDCQFWKCTRIVGRGFRCFSIIHRVLC